MASAKTVVIGLGNDLLADDAFGIMVARELKALEIDSLDIVEAAEHGLGLLDYLEGYEKAIIVDAFIGTEKGKIMEVELTSWDRAVAPSLHALSLPEALHLGRKAGLRLPERVKVYSVTVLNSFVIGGEMSEEVERSVPVILNKILKDLRLGEPQGAHLRPDA
jgi:hydrogenase maturation protease